VKRAVIVVMPGRMEADAVMRALSLSGFDPTDTGYEVCVRDAFEFDETMVRIVSYSGKAAWLPMVEERHEIPKVALEEFARIVPA